MIQSLVLYTEDRKETFHIACIQHMRYIMVEAAIHALKKDENSRIKRRDGTIPFELVSSWLVPDDKYKTGINYGAMETTLNDKKSFSKWFHQSFMPGLIKFVKHCASDGFHSPGDCQDIAEAIRLLIPHARIRQNTRKEWEELQEFFTTASKTKSIVSYMKLDVWKYYIKNGFNMEIQHE